ncbi:MAG: hypothetical protein HKM02_02375 [Pseudomonadales bacterium]|nr:hypothetical protein [Pseudomonadales bacterium]
MSTSDSLMLSAAVIVFGAMAMTVGIVVWVYKTDRLKLGKDGKAKGRAKKGKGSYRHA